MLSKLDQLVPPSEKTRPTGTFWLLLALILAGAALSIGMPAWQLLTHGPFMWHVSQPQSWQGAIELVVLATFLYLGFRVRTRWLGLCLVGIPTLLYLRRHAIDVSLLIDVVYLEIVIGLGMFIRRRLGLASPDTYMHYLQAFIAGFAAWSLFAWTLSALDMGSIKALRWLTLLMALPALYAGRRPMIVFLWTRMRSVDHNSKLWAAAVSAWMIALFARTKTAIGYDALWYGLQGEYVLAPGYSVYEPLGLVSPVHYYPKLYEMFLLPVSAAGDASVISGISVLLFVVVLITCRLLARELDVPRKVWWPVIALIATLPAAANVATEPKTDIPAALFVMLSLLSSMRFVRTRSWSDAAWMLSAAALACHSKLTAIPYVGVLLLATGCVACARRGRSTAEQSDSLAIASFVLLITALVTLFVLARTYLLTGLPTIGPDPLFKLWHMLGFELREPAGTLDWANPQDWRNLPSLVMDWLFRPQNMSHIVISWIGNVWVWLACVATLAALLLRQDAPRANHKVVTLALALVGTGIVLATSISYIERGGDGNYFLFALIPAILVSTSFAFRKLSASPALLATCLACLPAIAAFQAGYSFVSGSWTPGTRAFDLNFSRSWKQMKQQNEAEFARAGITKIAQFLKNSASLPRVVGFVDKDELGFRLPARYENIPMIAYMRPAYVENANVFLNFLIAQRINYIILPLSAHNNSGDSAQANFSTMLETLAGARIILDEQYMLFDLTSVSATELQQMIDKTSRDKHPALTSAE